MNTIVAYIGQNSSPTPSIGDLFVTAGRSNPAIECRYRNGLAVGTTTQSSSPGVCSAILEQDDYLLVLDGQFYNRSELKESLDTGLRGNSPDTDVELLLTAYQYWGQDCIDHIIGDFSFIIWDSTRESLYCARDRTGIRSLYYTKTSSGFLISSELAPLLAHPSVDTTANEGLLAEHFLENLTSRSETFYNDVQKIPAGTILIADRTGTDIQRYWLPSDGPQLEGLSEDELVARLRELLNTVVTSQIQHPEATAVLMSGGMDSTAIACQAQRSVETTIPAISAIFNELPAQDEREHIQTVAEHCNLSVHKVRGCEHWPLSKASCYETAMRGGPRCDMNMPLNSALYQEAASRGRPVLLTGIGGNAFDGTRLSYTDRLAQGELIGVFTDMLRDSVSTLSLLYWYGLSLIAPGIIYRLSALTSDTMVAPDSVLGPTLQSRVDLSTRLEPSETPEGWGEALQHFWRNDLGVHRDFALSAERRMGRHLGVEFRYPLLDARIIEFIFALPARQRFQAGEKKHLFREAMVNRLPESVRTQKKTVDFSPIAHRGFRHREATKVRSLQKDSLLVERGYIDSRWFDQVVSRYLEGDNTQLTSLWHLLSAELWMRNYEV